ncbi:response regulator transcription factor [Butyricicoccus sp.]|uniref:response regulator transcription factor n=1 Tax=Butyricicoccus sp. TaxID=2049021 RepID=UPI003F1846D0
MKKIILADDDFLVRSYLSQLVDWEANGYMLAGVAQDGEQALELAEKLKPDIVIADIDMPVMNGIALLQKLKEKRNPARVVMLSCHDDFEYVKEAMRIGADEYLLKDAVTPEKLLQTLKEIAPAESDAAAEDTKELTEEQERKQLLQLLEGTVLSCESIAPDAVIAVRLTEYEETMAYQPVEQRELFYHSFRQTCEGAGRNLEEVRCVHVRGGLFAVLCQFHAGMSRQSQQLALRETASSLVQEADRHFAIAVKVGVSDAAEYSTDTSVCWSGAKDALEHAFYQPGSIFYAWQCGKMGNMLPRAAEEFLKEAEELAAHRDSAEIKTMLAAALESFSQEQTRESLVAGWLHSADRKLGVETRPMPKRFSDLREIVQVYPTVCEEMLPDVGQYSKGVADTIRFIQEHYRENISLTDAANAVHLTTTYLSFVFHKETDITFSEYLQSCRINHAKELLERTNERVREIGALVGYNDNRHFSRIFKKTTGMTPQEYRKEWRK